MAEHPSYRGAAMAGIKLYACVLRAVREGNDGLAIAEIRECLSQYEEVLGVHDLGEADA